MKKIFSILLLAFFIGGNFSFAATYDCGGIGALPCTDDGAGNCANLSAVEAQCVQQQTTQVCSEFPNDPACAGTTTPPATCTPGSADPACTDVTATDTNNCADQDSEWVSEGANNSCPSGYEPVAQGCCGKITTSNSTSTDLPDDQTIMGMTIGPKCLLNGQCKFNIYDALGIRTSVRNEGDPTSVGIFVQDIVLSATMFIGTVVTIAIIVSGLMRIMAGASGKDPTKAKTGLINALIGLLIVVSSYLIIRLVQYIAKGF